MRAQLLRFYEFWKNIVKSNISNLLGEFSKYTIMDHKPYIK